MIHHEPWFKRQSDSHELDRALAQITRDQGFGTALHPDVTREFLRVVERYGKMPRIPEQLQKPLLEHLHLFGMANDIPSAARRWVWEQAFNHNFLIHGDFLRKGSPDDPKITVQWEYRITVDDDNGVLEDREWGSITPPNEHHAQKDLEFSMDPFSLVEVMKESERSFPWRLESAGRSFSTYGHSLRLDELRDEFDPHEWGEDAEEENSWLGHLHMSERWEIQIESPPPVKLVGVWLKGWLGSDSTT